MSKYLNIISTLILILSMGLISSCNEDENEGIAKVGVKMQAVTAGNSITASGRVQSTLNFTEVLVGVTELELETLEEDESEDEEGKEHDEGEIEFEGKFIVDLIDGTSDPDFGFTELPVGIYEELEIKMAPILEGGHTIYVAFEFIPDEAQESVSVIYTYDSELEFELESHSGFELDGTGINQLLVLFDLDILLHGIDLVNAETGDDGIVHINGERNSDIANKFKNNLAQMLKAGEDDDDDGEFDDDEEDDD